MRSHGHISHPLKKRHLHSQDIFLVPILNGGHIREFHRITHCTDTKTRSTVWCHVYRQYVIMMYISIFPYCLIYKIVTLFMLISILILQDYYIIHVDSYFTRLLHYLCWFLFLILQDYYIIHVDSYFQIYDIVTLFMLISILRFTTLLHYLCWFLF